MKRKPIMEEKKKYSVGWYKADNDGTAELAETQDGRLVMIADNKIQEI